MSGKKLDFDGTGRAHIPMASPWGIGLLKYSSGALDSLVLKPNGTRLGGWLLNSSDNVFTITGDFDGDGKTEILVASPWGVGILEYSSGNIGCPMLKPNGTRFGGWLLNTADNRFGPVGDFDGDGRDEVLVTSPWGIGILKLSGDTFTCPVLLPNGTSLGRWTLDTTTDRFGPVGDYDGDGHDEFMVIGTSGIAFLSFGHATITAEAIVRNGQRMGGWLLNTEDNHFWPSADFDGRGVDDVLVTSPWGLGILHLRGNTVSSSVMAPNGTRCGGWLLNTADNRFAPLGDLDGDRKAEILVSSPWGLGVLKKSGNTLAGPWLAPNGTRFGGWLLNTADNRFDLVADLDGDGRDEIVVTSPWGLGILEYSHGHMTCPMLAPNGTRFGGWLLNTADNQVAMGDQLIRLHIKILTSPSISLNTMISRMRWVYERLGLIVQLVSTEELDEPLLNDIDVGGCTLGSTTSEQNQLFAHRNNAGPNDVVAYFVRSTVPPYNGCASHPAGRPGCVVVRGASPWTLAHEVGHDLGLRHVGTATNKMFDRLMTGYGTANITNPPADLVATEAITLRNSTLSHNQ